MDKAKRTKLEAAGWAVATPKEFLNLSDEDAAFIEVKVTLAAVLRAQRVELHMSQTEAAKRLCSSQSRVAKMEAADNSVSVDLLLRSFLKLGGTGEMVAAALSSLTKRSVSVTRFRPPHTPAVSAKPRAVHLAASKKAAEGRNR